MPVLSLKEIPYHAEGQTINQKLNWIRVKKRAGYNPIKFFFIDNCCEVSAAHF